MFLKSDRWEMRIKPQEKASLGRYGRFYVEITEIMSKKVQDFFVVVFF